MENYIKELIQNTDRVIIPGFGAIMHNKQSGAFYFNEFIRFDDGVLESHISIKENCTPEEAKQKLLQFHDKLVNTLNQGTTFVLEGLGSFNKDEKGKVIFTQSGISLPSVEPEKKETIIPPSPVQEPVELAEDEKQEIPESPTEQSPIIEQTDPKPVDEIVENESKQDIIEESEKNIEKTENIVTNQSETELGKSITDPKVLAKKEAAEKKKALRQAKETAKKQAVEKKNALKKTKEAAKKEAAEKKKILKQDQKTAKKQDPEKKDELKKTKEAAKKEAAEKKINLKQEQKVAKKQAAEKRDELKKTKEAAKKQAAEKKKILKQEQEAAKKEAAEKKDALKKTKEAAKKEEVKKEEIEKNVGTEPIQITEPEVVIASAPPVTTAPEIEEPVEQSPPIVPPLESETTITEDTPTSAQNIETHAVPVIEEEIKKAEKPEKPKKEKKVPKQKKEVPEKKKRRFIWLWILLFLIAAGVAWALVFPEQFNELKEKLPFIGGKETSKDDGKTDDNDNNNQTDDNSLPIDTIAVDTSTMQIDTILINDSIENITVNDVTNNNTQTQQGDQTQQTSVETHQFPKGDKLYYVVVGCFEVESNADRYVIALKEKGCDSRKFGMRGRLHMVCCKAFSNRKDGINEMNNIRADFEPNAWVLYY